MPTIPWNAPASLMRITPFATADEQEELVARGTVADLVGQVLARPAGDQRDLLLRAAGADWVEEYDTDAIRELAVRPDYTGAAGAFDTAALADDPDRATVAPDDAPVMNNRTSAPSFTDARGRDGDR